MAPLFIGNIACVRRINFASFYDFSIGFWNCSDFVVFFIFRFIAQVDVQREITRDRIQKSKMLKVGIISH